LDDRSDRFQLEDGSETLSRMDEDTSSFPTYTGPDLPMPQVVVDFPVVLRGYDRQLVDDHLARLAEDVVELHAQRSPQAVVKRALDKVGEETSAILQRAHETADEITTRSRRRAAERVEEAEREAARIHSTADSHVRALDESVDTIWAERHRLIEDVRRVGESLLKIADEALVRFPPEEGPPTPPKPLPAGTGPATAAGRGETGELEEVPEAAEDGEAEDTAETGGVADEPRAEEDEDPDATVAMEHPPEIEPDVSEGIQSIRPLKRD
jgi:DivIVA protein